MFFRDFCLFIGNNKLTSIISIFFYIVNQACTTTSRLQRYIQVVIKYLHRYVYIHTHTYNIHNRYIHTYMYICHTYMYRQYMCMYICMHAYMYVYSCISSVLMYVMHVRIICVYICCLYSLIGYILLQSFHKF